jgi:hypothetical protein
MPFIAAAAVGAVGAIGGAIISGDASKSAANTQAQAAQNANATQIYMQGQGINEQNQMLDVEAGLMNPSRISGNQANQALQYALGLPQTSLAPVTLPDGTVVNGNNTLNFGPTGGAGGSPVMAQPGGGIGPQITPGSPLAGMTAGGGAGPNGQPSTPAAMQDGLAQSGIQPGSQPGAAGGAGSGIASLFQPFSYTAGQYQQSPGYQFTLQQGLQAIQNQASATGMNLSPNTMKDLSGYAEGLANQDYQQSYQNAYNAYTLNQSNMLNALGGMAGYGNTAANNLGSAAGSTGANVASTISNTANNVSANQIGAGNALAAGQVGSANALSGGLNNLANTYTQSALLNQFMNPSSGAGGYNFTMPSTAGSGIQYGLGSGLNFNLNQ